MLGRKTVVFDACPDSALRYLDFDVVVAIDVFCATTTLVTAAALGRAAYSAPSLAEAVELGETLAHPLLACDYSGEPPAGFELPVSGAALIARDDLPRPLVVCSSPGTELLANAGGAALVLLACLRNLTATADHIARRAGRVAVLAAGSRGQLRCEDQMAAAWLIERLLGHGFAAQDRCTAELVPRWSAASVDLVRLGSSAEELNRRGRGEEIEFVLDHVDDLDLACTYQHPAVAPIGAGAPRPAEARRQVVEATTTAGRHAPVVAALAALGSSAARAR